jgi:hypothetical protein
MAKPGAVAAAAKSEPAATNAGTNRVAATDNEARGTPVVQGVPRPSAPRGLIESWSTLFRSRLNEGGG